MGSQNLIYANVNESSKATSNFDYANMTKVWYFPLKVMSVLSGCYDTNKANQVHAKNVLDNIVPIKEITDSISDIIIIDDVMADTFQGKEYLGTISKFKNICNIRRGISLLYHSQLDKIGKATLQKVAKVCTNLNTFLPLNHRSKDEFAEIFSCISTKLDQLKLVRIVQFDEYATKRLAVYVSFKIPFRVSRNGLLTNIYFHE